MEFANLGESGLKVSKIIFGGMSIGSSKWREWVIDEEEALVLLKKAYDVGIRTFDTANMYSNGESERIIGKFLKKYNIPRSTVVILTKVYFLISEPGIESNELNAINRSGLSRKHIFDSVEAAMERLGTYIDVLQIHRLDKETPMPEIMRSLHDVVQSGKVRYIGASSMRGTEFAQLQFIAEKNGWTKFISMQDYYNAVYREEEREMIPFCKATGVGIIPWSPIARGILARPFSDRTNSLRGSTDFYLKTLGLDENTAESIKEIISRIEQIAKKRGKSMAQIATAWVLSKGCFPILGFNKVERIDEAVDSLSIKLTEDELKLIEEPYRPQPVHGYV